MIPLKKIPDKGDPSDIIQFFPNINIELLCCRYWWINNWEYNELSYPYWRIYNNKYDGAIIKHDGKTYELDENKIILIPPNTSFSTYLFDHTIPKNGYLFNGDRITHNSIKDIKGKYVYHLFIHFKLGTFYDNIKPSIFVFNITEHLRNKLDIIKHHLMNENHHFDFHVMLNIQSLITDLLSEIDQEKRHVITADYRILDSVNFIDNNFKEDLCNEKLAKRVSLATNAFTRLFRNETGVAPQKYIRKKRIDESCILLHHTNLTIDEIASFCGFADRYHFSRVFKQITKISPAIYRKNYHFV